MVTSVATALSRLHDSIAPGENGPISIALNRPLLTQPALFGPNLFDFCELELGALCPNGMAIMNLKLAGI